MEILNLVLTIIAFILTIPCVVFCLECLAALLPKNNTLLDSALPRPKTTILIPAHNEAEQIATVVTKILEELTERDRVVVIADNCHDNTAELARNAGATVLERENKTERGKGYALAYGMNFIKDDPPEAVVILDGDCLVKPQTIANITRLACTTLRPVQSTYLMDQPDDTSLKDRISMFSLKVKNLVRLLGLNRLGLHSLLTGSGMAFPWEVINRVSLEGSKTTDDTQLTVDLALTGCRPIFCEDALVIGRLMKDKDAQSQRSRWEHGHLEMILVEVPRLVKAFISQGGFPLIILALDIGIPPLSLLVTIVLLATMIAWLAVIFGASLIPAIAITSALLILTLGVFIAWVKFGRSDLSINNLVAIPVYILSKIPIYFKFLTKPQSRWLKTERDISNS
jgi:cellulose synthase/poly-beta-1,6-N-acetylglucosamine synthase-like glycosyltransferase